MSADNLPVLYSFRRCPYAMRARLAIAVSGQRCELREVVLKNKPPELLAALPQVLKATVPVLVLPGGEVIAQSLDIMQWALRQHDPEGWLAADLPAQLALIAANDSDFKHDLDRYKYPNRHASLHGGDEQGFALAHRSNASSWLMGLEVQLARHAWLFSPGPSLADMAILPFVRQFACTDMGWFEQQAWPHLQRWLAGWAGSEFFDGVMSKYPPWASGTAGVRFP